jgi:hypothetical protein
LDAPATGGLSIMVSLPAHLDAVAKTEDQTAAKKATQQKR